MVEVVAVEVAATEAIQGQTRVAPNKMLHHSIRLPAILHKSTFGVHLQDLQFPTVILLHLT